MNIKKKIAILGSTGSVGCSTLEVVEKNSELYEIYALTACSSVAKMAEQCCKYSPALAVMSQEESAEKLAVTLREKGCSTRVLGGQQALINLMKDDCIDSVMVAIVGAVGLEPSLEAVRQGKQVMIANKEPLVMAGDLFMAEAKRSGAAILPIDSEHNAIFQCLPYPDLDQSHIRRLVLTASGGPFLGRLWDELNDITPAQAIAHPNWSMGPKISVDSATMMNKGLELIEATHLFAMSAKKIDVLIHPQSVIHSMVEYVDGSHLAQLGSPDMCIPIAHAMAFPGRIESGAERLDLAKLARLDFQEPDWQQTPCLSLARQVAVAGGVAPIVMNAANEVAVAEFIKKSIGFTDIYTVIDRVLSENTFSPVNAVSDILSVDELAREKAYSIIKSLR